MILMSMLCASDTLQISSTITAMAVSLEYVMRSMTVDTGLWDPLKTANAQ